MLDATVRERIARIVGDRPVGDSPLQGGCVARVVAIDTEAGTRVVAKIGDDASARLDVEGMMLETLARAGAIRVPRVLAAEPDLLVMEHIASDGRRSAEGEAELARALARLHAAVPEGAADGLPRYGFACDTLIGGLTQPNPWSASWPAFYAEQRLLDMGRRAREAGGLDERTLGRLEDLASDIDRVLPAPSVAGPSLIHGDLWAGNVLWHGGRPAAVIDPAVYFADPEVELAFIDLMGGMGRAFWEAYDEASPLRPGFWETRRDVYVLYPLLVHARLFGGGYGASVASTLTRLGF